jgi:hypothetical protein
MILLGIGLIVGCGVLLFFVYGLASMVPPDDPGYWSLVSRRMFGLEHGGWVAIPTMLGLLLGVILVSVGISRRGRSAKPGASPVRP